MKRTKSQSEALSRAFAWFREEREAHPERDTHSLMDEAGMRFNLNPLEAEQLIRLLHNKKQHSEDE